MSAQLGLISPKNTHSNVSTNLYLKKGEAIIDPVLVAPVSIESSTGSTTGVIGIQGNPSSGYFGALDITTGAGGVGVPQRLAITADPTASGVDVWIGANTAGSVNRLQINGGSGLSRVYDPVYNPVPVPSNDSVVASFSGSIPANVGPGLWTYTPTVSGAYMLQVNFNVFNGDTIPADGVIEWVLNVGGGEVQYCSNTLKSISIAKASDFTAPPFNQPMDYSFSNLATLTAGQQVSFYLLTSTATAPNTWSVSNYQVRLVKMC